MRARRSQTCSKSEPRKAQKHIKEILAGSIQLPASAFHFCAFCAFLWLNLVFFGPTSESQHASGGKRNLDIPHEKYTAHSVSQETTSSSTTGLHHQLYRRSFPARDQECSRSAKPSRRTNRFHQTHKSDDKRSGLQRLSGQDLCERSE
jgi:hypothetical protein